MKGHANIGRGWAGKIRQLITGSVGLPNTSFEFSTMSPSTQIVRAPRSIALSSVLPQTPAQLTCVVVGASRNASLVVPKKLWNILSSESEASEASLPTRLP